MQAVAYYVELLQYEIVDQTTVEPPFTGNAVHDAVTESIASSTASVVEPATTPGPLHSRPTAAHAPGNYAPIVIGAAVVSSDSRETEQQVLVTPAPSSKTTTAKYIHTDAQLDAMALLSISNQQFFNWFLQRKEHVKLQEDEMGKNARITIMRVAVNFHRISFVQTADQSNIKYVYGQLYAAICTSAFKRERKKSIN